MKDNEGLVPELGQVVEVLRGRDSGQYMVVIGMIGVKFVLLADGYKRKFDRPKKKNIRHIRLCDFVGEEVARSLSEHGSVTDAKLRHVLQQFHLTHPHEDEKGE